MLCTQVCIIFCSLNDMLCYSTFGATGGGLGTLEALEEERKKGKRKLMSCDCTTTVIFHFNISFEKCSVFEMYSYYISKGLLANTMWVK